MTSVATRRLHLTVSHTSIQGTNSFFTENTKTINFHVECYCCVTSGFFFSGDATASETGVGIGAESENLLDSVVSVAIKAEFHTNDLSSLDGR